MPPHSDPEVVALYQAGATYDEIAEKVGVQRNSIADIIRRNNVPLRGRRSAPIRSTVIDLAREGKDAHEIAAAVSSSYHSVSTILSSLRRKGEIGIHDGRVLRRSNDGAPSQMTMPSLRIELDQETRTLLDGEAIDLEVSPAEVAHRILRSVLADQELLEAALAA